MESSEASIDPTHGGAKRSLMNAAMKVATRILAVVIGNAMAEKFGLLPIGAHQRAKMLGFGEGTRVYPTALIYGQPKIGKNVFIGPYTVVDGTGHLTIGDNCHLSLHAMVWTHDTTEWCLLGDSAAKGKMKIKSVVIENNVWIGAGAIVTPGVHVGHHSIIASGSIVTADVPPHTMVAGIPARVKRKIRLEGKQVFYDLP